MKKILLLILVLWVNIEVFSQVNDTIYYKSTWEIADSSEYDYYLIKDGDKKDGAFTAYYKSGEIRCNFIVVKSIMRISKILNLNQR